MEKLRTYYDKVLFWGERHSHTDLHYLVSGGSWLFLGQVVSIMTSLLLAVGYANFLPKEAYGTYKYILSIFGILSVFTLIGMYAAAQKGVAQGKEGVFWDTFKYRLVGGIGATLGCGVVGVYYFLQGNTLLAAAFLVSAPFLFALDPLAHYGSLLIGKKLFRQQTIYGIILQVLTAVVLFATLLYTDSVLMLITVYVIANLLLRGVMFLFVVKKFPPNDIRDQESVSFGKHLSATTTLATLTSRLDAILLFHFLGPVALATYSFSRAASENLQSALKLITGTIAFPKFAAQEKNILKATLERKVLWAHAVTIPLCLGAAIVIPFLYRWLFPAYQDSIIYAQVLVFLLAFSPLRFFSTAITVKASPKIFYASAITSPVLYSILLFICVPLWGIWGAIIATAVQQSVINVLNLYLFRRM